MKRLDELKKQVSEGALSRREFMQRTAALGVAAGTSSALFSSAAQASTPKFGGHARVGWTGGSTTDSLDPIHLTSTFTGMLFYNIGSQLTEITSEGQLGPELAESWEANQGATEWTFNLRQGVEFHNGKTLDADDVIASIDRQRGEDSQSATKSIAETITEMRKDGPNRVIFTLQEGNADFPVSLSAQTFYILPVVDGQVQPGIGTGGYMLDSWDAGVRGSLKRHPNFFREDRAFFDSVEITVVADPTSRQTGLVTGRVRHHRRCAADHCQPARQEGGRQGAEHPRPQALHLPHAPGHGALQGQQRSAPRAQVRLRPPGRAGSMAARLRRARQRPSDLARQPLLRSGYSAARVRPGQGRSSISRRRAWRASATS